MTTARSQDARSGAHLLFDGVPGMRARLQMWRPFICPVDEVLAWVPEHATVFDIGCGAGLLPGLLALRPQRGAICGVDASESAIALAKTLAHTLATTRTSRPAPPPTPSHVEFHVTPSTADWPSGPFDVVMMVDVLHHIPPTAQQAFVSAALARVGPGGRFVYKDMARRPLLHATANRMHDLLIAREWIHYVDPAVVSALAENAGLVSRHVSHRRMWWYAHDLLVFDRPAPAHAHQ